MKILIQLLIIVTLIQNAVAADKKTEAKDEATPDSTTNFFCTVDIYSSWQPAPVISSSEVSQKGKKATADLQIEPQKPIEEFFQSFREIATTEQSAREKITARIPYLLSEAQKNCESKHQGLATCYATKAKSFGTEYQMLDFDTRRVLLDSVREDCKQVSGKCISNRASEVICTKEQKAEVKTEADKKEKKTKSPK